MRSYTNDIFGAPVSPRHTLEPGTVVEILPGETPDDAWKRAFAAAQTSPRHPVAADAWRFPTKDLLALPTESEDRKKLPIATGVVDYFPLAFAAIAELSRIGNDKHNPGMPLHWSRGKSDDHPDALMRHFIERGKVDVNGVRHSAQVAWRALAILQLELEKAAIDAMEENAWRLGQRVQERKWPEEVNGQWREGWRTVPETPEYTVWPPCDVERP